MAISWAGNLVHGRVQYGSAKCKQVVLAVPLHLRSKKEEKVRRKKEERKQERVLLGVDTTARSLPPRWRCVRSPGSTANYPLLSSTAIARGVGGLPLLTRPFSGAGSPRHHLPRPVGRRARDGLWGTFSALRSPWSAPRTPPYRYTVASARLPATAAPSNDARSGLPSFSIWFDLVVLCADVRCQLFVH